MTEDERRQYEEIVRHYGRDYANGWLAGRRSMEGRNGG